MTPCYQNDEIISKMPIAMLAGSSSGEATPRSRAHEGDLERQDIFNRARAQELRRLEAMEEANTPIDQVWDCCGAVWSRILCCFDNPRLPPDAVASRKVAVITSVVSALCVACFTISWLEEFLLPDSPALQGTRLEPLAISTDFRSANRLRSVFEAGSLLTGCSVLPVLFCAKRFHLRPGDGAWPHTICMQCVIVSLVVHIMIIIRWMMIDDAVNMTSLYVNQACHLEGCPLIGSCPGGGFVNLVELQLQQQQQQPQQQQEQQPVHGGGPGLYPAASPVPPESADAARGDIGIGGSGVGGSGFDCSLPMFVPMPPGPAQQQMALFGFLITTVIVEGLQIYYCNRARVALLSPPAGSSMI